jgi:hypothetical protein
MAVEEALSNAGILQNIFAYQGPGSWLFLSPVSKLWKQWYERLDPTSLRASCRNANIHSTMYGEVFRSPSRFRMACEHGLQPLFEQLQDVAGILCDVPTLLAAQELGFQVTDTCLGYAAASGNLAILKLLHTDQGLPLPADVGHGAAARAQMDVLPMVAGSGLRY